MAALFCHWLNEKAVAKDIPACYSVPTEREWEYACRGGNPRAFCYGDDPRYADFFAICNGSEPKKDQPFPVATKMPNFYGIFDMHGNVWEICDEEWRDSYDAQNSNPDLIVTRGGALYNPAVRCRSAQRRSQPAKVAASYVGFRVILDGSPCP